MRLPACRSSFDDMITNSTFKRLIPDDTIKDPKKILKLVLCTGKTYYDLEVARKERGKGEEIALVRIEQVGFLRDGVCGHQFLYVYKLVKLFMLPHHHVNLGVDMVTNFSLKHNVPTLLTTKLI